MQPDLIDSLEPDHEMSIPLDEDEGPPLEETRMQSAPWGLDAIGVPEKVSTGRGVHIFIHDTGIRTTHVEFGGRAVPTLDMIKRKFCKSSDVTCAADVQGHGTHCAATAGGNSFGVANQATIHALKTMDDRGAGSGTDSIYGINYVITRGARPSVLSMSISGPSSEVSVTRAVDVAVSRGVTVVVSAGNNKADTCTFVPSQSRSAITVAATDEEGRRSSFSNFGSCNNIFAPGTDVLSAAQISDTGAIFKSGTSMAAPHVSGAAALILENHRSLLAPDVFNKMYANGKKNAVSGRLTGDPNLFLWVGGL